MKMEMNDGSADYGVEKRKLSGLIEDRGYLDSFGMEGRLLIKDTEPRGLQGKHRLSYKKGFFGLEAHLRTPIETIAIALSSVLFDRYEILIVDSFQLMNGAKPQEVNAAIGKTRHELELLEEAFGLMFDVTLCSDFFGTNIYLEVFRETEESVRNSGELTQIIRKTIPEGADKNDLSYAIHEISTTRYMRAFKGADVKVGQQREKLYDASIKEIVKGMGFAYLFPFFALGTKEPEEVTPYKPSSGTKNGGKRMLIDNFDKKNYASIAELLMSSSAEALKSLYRMALAAGFARLARGEVSSNEVFCRAGGFAGQSFPLDGAYLEKQSIDALFRFVIRPYEIRKSERAMEQVFAKLNGNSQDL